MTKRVVVIHGCGVDSPGTDNESLTQEGKMRVFGVLKELELSQKTDNSSEPSQHSSSNITFYLAGGKAQENLGQKLTEATHMKNYIEEVKKRFFPNLNITMVEEGESTDTLENITKVVDKTKEGLLDTLQGTTKGNIIAYTSDYHTNRAGLIRGNVLNSVKVPTSLLKVLSADKLKFDNSDLQKEYDKVRKGFEQERKKRSIFEKIKGVVVEKVGSLFAYLNMDKFLSKIHEKVFHRKKK